MYEAPLRIRATPALARISERINSQTPGTIERIAQVLSSESGDWVDSYDEEDEDLDDELDSDEEAPEGLGSGEIDWDTPGTLPDADDDDAQL
jgi:hypothetical protein